MHRRLRHPAAAAGCVALLASAAAAQQFGRSRLMGVRFASAADFDGRHFSPDGYAVGINALLYTMTH